jgi:hypothetical protein
MKYHDHTIVKDSHRYAIVGPDGAMWEHTERNVTMAKYAIDHKLAWDAHFWNIVKMYPRRPPSLSG